MRIAAALMAVGFLLSVLIAASDINHGRYGWAFVMSLFAWIYAWGALNAQSDAATKKQGLDDEPRHLTD